MQPAVSPCFVLAAYAEPLLEGRRVVVFGSATSGFDGALIQRGARLVHVYDTEVSRVAEATARATARNISYAPLAQAGVAVRDGAFDVAIVTDLSDCENAENLVKQVRRALSVRGVAIIASPNAEAPVRLAGVADAGEAKGYYEFYDAVAAEFEEVKMFGQAPFVGYAMAEFGLDREPEISIDSEFLPSGAEEPEWFVALASRHALTLDPFSVIQLPLSEIQLPEPAVADHELRQARKAEEEARAQVLKLQESLAQLKAQRAQVPQELKLELERLSTELAKRDAWAEELESRAETADQRADEVQAELAQERRANKQAAKSAQSSAKSSADSSAEVTQLEKKLEELTKRADQAQAELERERREHQTTAKAVKSAADAAKLQGKLEKLSAQADADRLALSDAKAEASEARAEVQRLEELLVERAKLVKTLERDLHHTERTGQQLLHELRVALDARAGSAASTTPQAPQNGETNGSSEKLLQQQAQRMAELEGDLEAARWTIQELEEKLS